MRYKKNIVITGIGIHSCLGDNIEKFTIALRDEKCGLHHDIERIKYGYQSDLCGNVPPINAAYLNGIRRSQLRCFSQPTQYALSAVRQALDMAGVAEEYLHNHNVSIIVSNDTTAEEIMQTGIIMQEKKDTRYLGAHAVFRSLTSTVSMNLSSVLGIHGLSLTLSAACAGGGHAVGMAKNLLETEQTDMVIVVGAQESNVVSMQSLDALGILATNKVRPFDKNREGLAPSGGAACVVMEREGRVTPLARVSGYGFSSNGYSVSTPDAKQEMRCMLNALHNAGANEDMSITVFAHATGTSVGDEVEAHAITRVFPNKPNVVATKGMTGHECWMAGVSQAVQAVIMLQQGFIPGAVGTDECEFPDINLIRKTIMISPENILCNAFGFGGTNSTFIISKVFK